MNRFDPGRSEIKRVITHAYDEIYRKDDLAIIERPTHPAFFRPVSASEVRASLDAVPRRFVEGLLAVVILGGSKKQEHVFKNLFAYGRYGHGVIFLHPFPKKFLERRYGSLPKPNVLTEYRRAGAIISSRGNSWSIRFDEGSLRRFYLRDVLMHELGHHVDEMGRAAKSNRKAEGFAEWFATEYGYRLHLRA